MKNNKIFKYSTISILLLALYGGNVYASGGSSGIGSGNVSPESLAGCSENHFSEGESSVTDKLYEYVCKAEAGEGIEITEEDITNDHITNDAGDNRIGKKITISNKNPFTEADKEKLNTTSDKTTANEGKITDLTGKVTTVTATADSALEKANGAIQKGSVIGKNGVKVEEKDGKVEVSSDLTFNSDNGITVTNNGDGTFHITNNQAFTDADKEKLNTTSDKATANEGKITDLTGKVTTVTATADSALEKANSAIQKGSVVGKNGVKVEEKDGKVEVSSDLTFTGDNGITVTNNGDGTFHVTNNQAFTESDKEKLNTTSDKATANEGKITDLTGKVTTVTATADSALEKANSAIQKGSVVGKNGVKVEEKDGKVEVSSTINITGSNGITVTNNNDGTFSVTSDSLFKQEDKQKLEKLTTEALKKSDLNVSSDENIVSTVRDGHISLGLSKHLQAEKITTGKSELSSDGLKVGSIKLTESGLSMDNKIIDNVADGEISKTSKQAVNGSQLNAVSNRVSVVENHVTNIDNKLNKMQSAIHKLDKKQNAGVASALAVNDIPQAFQSGKQLIGVGAGTRSGAHAIAVGFSRVSDNGKHIIKTSFAVDSEKKASGNIGYGYQW